MLEKTFINKQLGFELTSYIDNKKNGWFRGKDVATILGYSNTTDAIKRHVSENHKRKLLFGQPRYSRGWSMTYFIDEAGFYELVFSSKLEAAKKFRVWVFSKVLPSIRKFGYYKLFKIENETRVKQKVIIDGVKYYKHPVFGNYAASKNGDIISLRTKRIISKNKVNGYFKFQVVDSKLEKPKNYFQHRFIYEVFKGVIPRCLEIDHINNIKTDNRIKNLQLLSHYYNTGKSKNKAVISTCVETGKKKQYVSITKASIDLSICVSYISEISNKKKYHKTATSKKDCKKYTFEYLD